MRASILALDLGTTLGWAWHHSNGLTQSGSLLLYRRSQHARIEDRFTNFLKFLRQSHALDPLRVIYFEHVMQRPKGVRAAQVYGGFLALLQCFCIDNGIRHHGVPVKVIKKHLTGSGNADKARMIAACRMLGFDPIDDNEADAIGLLDYVLNPY